MNSTDKAGLQEDADDQGVVVSLPPEEEPSEGAGDPREKEAIGSNGQNFSEGGEATSDDDDREAIREARREERKLKKQLHREKSRESHSLINSLRKQNQAMAERLANLENRTSGAELARVDKVIDDTNVQIEYAKMKIDEAMKTQNGEAMAQAQELLLDARERLRALHEVKKQATKQMSQPQQQNINVPNVEVQKMAAKWMKKNSWYNPAGADIDSQVTQTIDRALTAEGYDPSTEEYWDELDDRVKKYIPHRTQRDRPKDGKKPGGAVTGSGREDSGSRGGVSEFRVSPERVQAMKEAGVWDNPEKRMQMIRKYAEYDRNNKARG